jgi:hypothetical protein
MLAAQVAAASTAPWGEINVPATETLDDNEEAERGEGEGWEELLERERLIALRHVPVCSHTAAFVRAATSGWSAIRHWLHHPTVQKAVHTLLLVSERHRQCKARATIPSVDIELPICFWGESDALPHMPPELWLVVAGFFLRRDWPMAAAMVPPHA